MLGLMIRIFASCRVNWRGWAALALLLSLGMGCDASHPGSGVDSGQTASADGAVAPASDLIDGVGATGDPDAADGSASPDATQAPDQLLVPEVLSVGKGPGLSGQEENELEQGETKLLVPDLEIADTPRWRLAWRDEFNGPQPDEDPSCHSRPPQCQYKVSGGGRDCPQASWAQLGQLNKCNWAVYSFFNYMSGAEGTNSFRADGNDLAR